MADLTLLDQVRRIEHMGGRVGMLRSEDILLLCAKLREVVEQSQHLRNVVTFKTPPVEFGTGNLCYEARVPVGFIIELEAALTPMKER